ncbi:hypothetical protein BIV57_16355 [Mangrovactinospora gilvigrisea]|uniref:Uncharacterized protein n=1 Tax=Mangrovactinospora gilvigrisea TaxID=1428644 RepID=A0A1J7BSJ6_9ACTN|nr:hypothetical protein [Mangrovactinospora gilvigrisea]OIV36433.1 hypothetical protein BIV57_16355 [Mangrovactinospora gilvigrisea]
MANQFLGCMDRIAVSGLFEQPGSSPDKTARRFTNDHGHGWFVDDNASHDIVTAYTDMPRTSTGRPDNNWALCDRPLDERHRPH